MTVHVYFVSQVYRVFIRSLLTNFISLIANLGGVYSLLIGMSVLSAFEIIYFFSIRLYLNYRDIKNDVQKPKTFSQRGDNVNISTLKVPRLDTAKSMISDISSFRSSAYSHYWVDFECNLGLPAICLQNLCKPVLSLTFEWNSHFVLKKSCGLARIHFESRFPTFSYLFEWNQM